MKICTKTTNLSSFKINKKKSRVQLSALRENSFFYNFVSVLLLPLLPLSLTSFCQLFPNCKTKND